MYKKASLKVSTDFQLRHTFKGTRKTVPYSISVFAKMNGKANTENKYDFPPPIDNSLFFGNCILVSKDVNNNTIDLTMKTWNGIYNKLFGGFDDIDNGYEGDESEDNDDDDNDDSNILPSMLSKEGYLKDDFISASSDDESEDDTIHTVVVPKSIKKRNRVEVKKNNDNDNYLGCEKELTFEEYLK